MSRVGETAELIIGLGGNVRMIYSELVEPHALGEPTIERGSHVEPDQNGFWWADSHSCQWTAFGTVPHAIKGHRGRDRMVNENSGWSQPLFRPANPRLT